VSNIGAWHETSVKAVTAQVTPSLDEDWEGYEVDDEPTFWMDHEADGDARTEFRVLLAGDNVAFGADYEAGTNLFSSYALPGVGSWQDYEYRGRLQRTDANGGLGVVVYSRYPASESKMYMLSYWPGGSFALEDHGTGVLVEGDLDAGVVPATSTWYRFRVQAATHDERVTLRAKVWVEGEAEPTLWQAVGYASSTLSISVSLRRRGCGTDHGGFGGRPRVRRRGEIR